MKTHLQISKLTLFAVFFLLVFNKSVNSQQKYVGNWEGTFMGEYLVIINLNLTNDQTYTGNIKMFNVSEIIQNDDISKIKINENSISFYIDAKQTLFEGIYNKDTTQFSGDFIFPDGSKHPLTAVKSGSNNLSDNNLTKYYTELKNKKHTKEELKSDLQLLIDTLKTIHPQLYSYADEEFMKKNFDIAYEYIDKEMTLEEFYKLIAPMFEKIKCSHTAVRLPMKYQQAVYENGNFLPVKIVCLNDKLYYLNNLDSFGSNISPGTEIISINNRPSNEIISHMITFIPSEGNNLSCKYNELNNNFNSYFYFLDDSESFNIGIITNGKAREITFGSINQFDYDKDKELSSQSLPIDFKIDTVYNVGFIKVKSFDIRNIEKYISLLDKVFKTLKNQNISEIVIDLRNNKGGHPIFAAQLFSYLTDKEFIYFKRNTYIEELKPLYEPIQPNKCNYKGKINVFVNGGCLSTTGHLISLIKYHTKAKFIGEEPGSTFCCNDNSIQLMLPNTKIEVNIPRSTFETEVTDFKKGELFNLDYNVSNSLKNLIEGTDSYMEFFFSLKKE